MAAGTCWHGCCFRAQRWGEHMRALWSGAEDWVPTRGEMLTSPGDISHVLTCSLGWKVCRALSSSRVAFRESSDGKKSFQGLNRMLRR